MAGVNKAILLGYVGRDPEIRYTNNGTAVSNLSIATTEKGKDGREQTEWHKIIAFGRLAEVCGEYMHKGKQVYIEGRIQTRSWEDRDGNKRQTTEIAAFTVQFLGGGSQQTKKDHGQKPPSQSNGQKSWGAGDYGDYDGPPDSDSIPF